MNMEASLPLPVPAPVCISISSVIPALGALPFVRLEVSDAATFAGLRFIPTCLVRQAVHTDTLQ